MVNSEDIDLGDGMEEDDGAEEPAADVQLEQKAVPVRSISSHISLPAPAGDTAAPKIARGNFLSSKDLHLRRAFKQLCFIDSREHAIYFAICSCRHLCRLHLMYSGHRCLHAMPCHAMPCRMLCLGEQAWRTPHNRSGLWSASRRGK